MQSSRVGVSTSAWTACSEASTYSMIGSPKGAVLAVSVLRWADYVTALQQRRDRLFLDRARRLVANVLERLQRGLRQPEICEGLAHRHHRHRVGSSSSLPVVRLARRSI